MLFAVMPEVQDVTEPDFYITVIMTSEDMPEVQNLTEPDFYITAIITSNDRECLFISNGSEIDRLTTRELKEYRKRLTAYQEENNVFQPNKRVLQDFFCNIALAC